MPASRQRLLPRNDDRALAALLEHHYPRAYRISVALCGEVLLARDVTRAVLRQATRMHHNWQTDLDAARWFAHHTILLTRQAATLRGGQAPIDDVLLKLTPDPLFITILRTLRFLPPQQREAFLIHHGEGFDLRQLATAMDCSAEAAANHLVAATTALRPVAQDRLGDFTSALPQWLGRLLPPRETIAIEARRQTSRYLWPRRIERYVGWPLLIVACVFIARFAWRFWQMLII